MKTEKLLELSIQDTRIVRNKIDGYDKTNRPILQILDNQDTIMKVLLELLNKPNHCSYNNLPK